MMKRISLHLTEKQLAALKRLKAETGLKVAEIIRRSVDAYLKKEGRGKG
jgi:hypothetical protein